MRLECLLTGMCACVLASIHTQDKGTAGYITHTRRGDCGPAPPRRRKRGLGPHVGPSVRCGVDVDVDVRVHVSTCAVHCHVPEPLTSQDMTARALVCAAHGSARRPG